MESKKTVEVSGLCSHMKNSFKQFPVRMPFREAEIYGKRNVSRIPFTYMIEYLSTSSHAGGPGQIQTNKTNSRGATPKPLQTTQMRIDGIWWFAGRNSRNLCRTKILPEGPTERTQGVENYRGDGMRSDTASGVKRIGIDSKNV